MIEDSRNKQVFTTGEAAKICNVSQQTIIRCFDSGRLNGFKVPGSRFRRIPRAELFRFMRSNNIEMDSIMSTGTLQVLVVGIAPQSIEQLIKTHTNGHNIEIHYAANTWEAGVLAQKHGPGIILCDSSLHEISEVSVAKFFNNLERLATTSNIATPIVVKIDKPNTDLGVETKNVDSNKIIEDALRQVVTA